MFDLKKNGDDEIKTKKRKKNSNLWPMSPNPFVPKILKIKNKKEK